MQSRRPRDFHVSSVSFSVYGNHHRSTVQQQDIGSRVAQKKPHHASSGGFATSIQGLVNHLEELHHFRINTHSKTRWTTAEVLLRLPNSSTAEIVFTRGKSQSSPPSIQIHFLVARFATPIIHTICRTNTINLVPLGLSICPLVEHSLAV